MDISFVGLLEAHDYMEKWIRSCIHPQQLAVFHDLVNDYFTMERFSDENPNAIYLAKASLISEISTQLVSVQKLKDANRQS